MHIRNIIAFSITKVKVNLEYQLANSNRSIFATLGIESNGHVVFIFLLYICTVIMSN